MDSQIITVAIGLFAVFFLVSIVASAVVEIINSILSKRSKDLNRVIDQMLSGGNSQALDLKSTSIYRALSVASSVGKTEKPRQPSYIAARSFADGVVEALVDLKQANQSFDDVVADLPDGMLKDRLTALKAEVGDDLGALKAGIESWYDHSMERLQGAFKRASRYALLAVGLLIAATMNVSTIRIVQELWTDDVLADAVADRATELVAEECPSDSPRDDDGNLVCGPEEKIEEAVTNLESLQLPVGWGEGRPDDFGGWFWMIIGWLPTGLAVTLGAPFWFDLLGRVAGLRGGRGAPPPAAEDPASSTTDLMTYRAGSAPALAAGAGIVAAGAGTPAVAASVPTVAASAPNVPSAPPGRASIAQQFG